MPNNHSETPEDARSGSGQTPAAVSTGGAAAHQNWRNIRLVMGREYRTRVRGRAFRITTALLVLVVVAGAFLPTIVQYFSSKSTSQTTVAIVNNAGLDNATLLAVANNALNASASPAPYAVAIQPAAGQAALLDQVRSGKLGVLLTLERGAGQALAITYYNNSSTNTDPNAGAVQALAQQVTFVDTAQRFGLTISQMQSLAAAPSLTTINTQASRAGIPTDQLAITYILAFVGGYVMLYAVLGYAGGVAQGVAQEKSSRVMEILINATTPFQLLAGKIVGIAAASLTQMAIMVVFGIGSILIQTPIQARLFGPGSGGLIVALASVSIPFYIYFLIYFLLNFFLYAAIYAGLGAMVKRPEEVAGATAIPTIIMVVGLLGVYLEVIRPDILWVNALLYIPVLTPMLVLGRLAVGDIGGPEIAVTIVLMLAAIYVCTLGAVRIYRHGVLNYGQRPGLGQLWKLARK